MVVLSPAGAELRKVHFAEEWNELHHLQIMESMGGKPASMVCGVPMCTQLHLPWAQVVPTSITAGRHTYSTCYACKGVQPAVVRSQRWPTNTARPVFAAGDQLWIDRFMAQHAAIVYYIILVGLFVASPKLAYNFSELIEAHAVDTYGEFADANEELLKTLPPPFVAAQYYLSGATRCCCTFCVHDGGRTVIRVLHRLACGCPTVVRAAYDMLRLRLCGLVKRSAEKHGTLLCCPAIGTVKQPRQVRTCSGCTGSWLTNCCAVSMQATTTCLMSSRPARYGQQSHASPLATTCTMCSSTSETTRVSTSRPWQPART